MPLHIADVGTDTMQEELHASNETRMSRELSEIGVAIQRISESPESFGVSESTGGAVPFERLAAIP